VCTKDIVDNHVIKTVVTVMGSVIFATKTMQTNILVLRVGAVVIGVTPRKIVMLESALPVATTPVSQHVVIDVGTIYVQSHATSVLLVSVLNM